MQTVISSSPDQTKQIAAKFAATLSGGEVVLLEGDMGSGKTTFAQGLVEALSRGEGARSPTFTLVNIYPVSQDRIKQVVHADLYRLKSDQELAPLALEEWLGRKDTVVLVEWPEIGTSVFLDCSPIRVHLDATSEQERLLTISSYA